MMTAVANRPGAADPHASAEPSGSQADLDHLRELIDHASEWLPAQGPLTVFIHHNTLHAFEHLPFAEAVVVGSEIFGCEPYLPEDRYRQELARARILIDDLEAELIADLGERADELLGFLGTRFHLRMAMLCSPVLVLPNAELRWFVEETDALRRYRQDAAPALRERFLRETRHWMMRDLSTPLESRQHKLLTPHERQLRETLDDLFRRFGSRDVELWSDETWEAFALQSLWRVCREGVRGVPPGAARAVHDRRHRDLLLAVTGEDSDLLVHDVLVRFCASFLDQGFAAWPLPDRERGFYQSFLALFCETRSACDGWIRGLCDELTRLRDEDVSPLESIRESLAALGVMDDETGDFLSETLLALRGWAGMIRQVETRPDSVAHPIPRGSLIEYVAVRLLLDRWAAAHVARATLGWTGPLCNVRQELRRKLPAGAAPDADQRAFVVFQLAQLLGWLPQDLHRLNRHEWITLIQEIESFSNLERRRIFQCAYERRYRVQILDALALHARPRADRIVDPKCQIVCCLDEREESYRRHIEEISPDIETFGAAGFFNTAIYFRGAADAHFVPLCPIVIKPQHWVQEDVVYTFEESHRRRTRLRRWLGAASHGMHLGSRSFAVGALLAAVLGPIASVPLVARVLFPWRTALLRRSAGRLVATPPVTQLRLERTSPTPGPQPEEIGFSVAEMAVIVERLLRDIGLTSGFARLVAINGHGSSSLNNPHESAHDCGACGGGRGGPNARAFARMANDPRIRAILEPRGISIPATTVFVGAYHNTCDESVTCYDLDRLPASHKSDFDELRRVLDTARERNAHERCRRFESAPLTLSPAAALRHVEARSEDLAQTRPEYGHATNAVCFVGRRSRTRGLYLDRRTFLTSYDPTQDDDQQAILTRILQAAVPVCAGINLEYYFSVVDPTGWGCGTKLPHNITSLLGVMDGAASDLRTGLPWQMVEIHEPVRLLFVIETTPDVLLRIMDRNAGIARLCRNQWVQIATLDPDSSRVHVFENGQFESYRPQAQDLPDVSTSVEWYRGWRDHLGCAVARGRTPTAAP